MAPSIRKPDPPGESEATDTRSTEKAPRAEFKSRDLGTKPMADEDPEHQNRRSSRNSGLHQSDAGNRYEVEAEDKNIPSPNSATSSVTPSEKKIIRWKDGDPENPYNWSNKRKSFIVLLGMLIVINSTMGSSLPSNSISFISAYFHITSPAAEVLPISIYLVGYVVGPLLFGPLSEAYGRQMILMSTFLGFTISTMACALAPTWGGLLVFRFFTGVNASSPNVIIGGVYADLYDNPVTRGRAMAMFMAGTCVGPLIAPPISGFISPALGWRWSFWIGLIFAGITWLPLIFLPETYGPVLLTRRARALRKSNPNDPPIFAPMELEKKGFRQMATVTLTRPLRMLCFELIVLVSSIYLSLAYGIFYMYFQAYETVFQGIYKQSPGVSGLMFLPIGAGAIAAAAVFLYWDNLHRTAQKSHKPWAQKEESRRLPLACLGGPLYVIALLWLGWTARPSIPFCVPMLAGIPFGMGFVLIFMALLNYLADAYNIFAASAMAAASCSRSVAGAVLPFAATPMYDNLGVAWASSLLGFLSLGMCAIPFAFLWKGDAIREGSTFCRFLKEKKAKEMVERELAREMEMEERERERERIAGEGVLLVKELDELV